MKRKIFIFGNCLPSNLIPEKTTEMRHQLKKEGLGELQTTLYVSSSASCYKTADLINEKVNGNNLHRTDGIPSSKLYPPKLLAEIVQGKENHHQIVVLVVNYSTDGLIGLLKNLGSSGKNILGLVHRQKVKLEKDIIFLDQASGSLQIL